MEGSGADELRRFFEELARNRKLYNDYLSNPLGTMRDQGISEDLIGLVLQGDLQALNNLFAQQAAGGAVICGTIVSG